MPVVACVLLDHVHRQLDGHVYVMQSYAQIVDPTLAYRDLSGLGDSYQRIS